MKHLLSVLLVLVSTLSGFSQNNSPTAPIFSFVEETHDFGTLKEGPVVSYDFEFKNTGKEPLIIQSCSASCGCTTPEWTKTPIMPGQKGKLTVKYNTQGRVGTFNKTVYIASNAKCDKERYEIYIKGNVVGEGTADKSKTAPAVKH
ncbi:MAG: DUF1573 domain-containing protein [Chitinophagaceae bacterium]|nr:DUF1573 domain-containing protein [Chitinophagaceae bacterium]